ncbi:MAG: DUF1211 domain-containing protein [Methanosarcinales archaeon]|nr:DUF1211 domain-containing protein [Methanosarcinales archaeon]
MTNFEEEEMPSCLDKGRIEALTDGIFAFAMTLLVINIEVPESSFALSPYVLLTNLHSDFLQYMIAFLALSGLWIAHHQQYNYFKSVDHWMVGLNISSLLLIALMPFSTQFADTYPADDTASAFFGLNLFFIGLLYTLQWIYATRDHRMVSPALKQDLISRILWKNMLIPAISLLVVILSLLNVPWVSGLYFSIPLIFMVMHGYRSANKGSGR